MRESCFHGQHDAEIIGGCDSCRPSMQEIRTWDDIKKELSEAQAKLDAMSARCAFLADRIETVMSVCVESDHICRPCPAQQKLLGDAIHADSPERPFLDRLKALEVENEHLRQVNHEYCVTPCDQMRVNDAIYALNESLEAKFKAAKAEVERLEKIYEYERMRANTLQMHLKRCSEQAEKDLAVVQKQSDIYRDQWKAAKQEIERLRKALQAIVDYPWHGGMTKIAKEALDGGL